MNRGYSIIFDVDRVIADTNSVPGEKLLADLVLDNLRDLGIKEMCHLIDSPRMKEQVFP